VCVLALTLGHRAVLRGALDKTAIYDEEDQLLIISEMYVALIVFTHTTSTSPLLPCVRLT
jgi:hypothetical protein